MRIWNFIKSYWRTFNRPATHLSLGLLSMGGFIAGIIFWGGFNTAMEFTNTEPFCISCHEMQANPFQELATTIHYTNRSGVRSEEHTSELQSRGHLVCRLLLEKKK